jgi:hypothetical protein
MHAVVVRVNMDDSEAATARLREDVVPRVSQAPGFVAGYWTRKGQHRSLDARLRIRGGGDKRRRAGAGEYA